MSKIPEPRYCLGNKIRKDDYCTVVFMTPPVFKVIAVEDGGIHTSNGITPALVRIVCDMTLRQMPGQIFGSLVQVIGPGNQEIIEAVADHLPRSD